MNRGRTLEARLNALIQSFDQSFGRPLELEREEKVGLLVVALGAHRFGLPVAELSGVYSGRGIVPVPGTPVACLGVAGVRGQAIGVYDLASALGMPPLAQAGWLLVSRARPDLGFATVAAERYVHVSRSAILARDVDELAPDVGAVSVDDLSLTVLSVDRLARAIGRDAP